MDEDVRKEEAGTTEDWGLTRKEGRQPTSCNCRLCPKGDQSICTSTSIRKAVIEALLTAASMSITFVDLDAGREIILLLQVGAC